MKTVTNVKTTTAIVRILLLLVAAISADGVSGQKGMAQEPAKASAGVVVSTFNGLSVVSFNGKEIYSGPTTGLVTSRSAKVNGVEQSVVYDDAKLLWESAPGVGDQLMPKAKVSWPPQDPSSTARTNGATDKTAVITLPQSPAAELGAGSGVSVVITNAYVVITQNGKRVYSGPFAGTVGKQTGTIHGVEQSAVYDDDILLWESAPGVGRQLRPQPDPFGQPGSNPDTTTPFSPSVPSMGQTARSGSSINSQSGGPGFPALNLPSMPSLGQHAHSGISVSTVNGQSVISLNGKEIYRGPATGAVSSRSSNVNGVEYNAVFDGDKVLWENVPGAAQQLQSQPAGVAGGGVDLSQFAEQHRQAFERMVEAQRQFMQRQGGMAFGTNFTMSSGGARGMRGGGAWGSTGGSAQGMSGGSARGSSSGSSSGGSSGQVFGSSGVRSSGFGSPALPGQPLPLRVPQNSETGISLKTIDGSTVIVYQGREFSVGPTTGNLSVSTKNIQGDEFAAAFEGSRVIWENVPGAAQKVK